ncbi:Calcipressin [Geosmithia morbida]|uniref:Calcipressin n=1 Tax=Geosmithia morbida TaxID=1094350 RepID=A0A9P5D5E2_9HYPO|nr:Calcipressin [Geosmithia morbida]KAF4123695.1 Calcipressin [Geosmithia morbida]
MSTDQPTAAATLGHSHRPSRSSSTTSRKSNLSLDLSSLPPFIPPTPPSNTLLFTNLTDPDIFRPDNLATIRNLISASAFIHAFSPLRSFCRIVVSFFDEESAIRVRSIWDGEAIMGHRVKIYFGQNTPVHARREHLALPDAGKLFFISPPPSPPHGWEMRLEDAPNKLVHADDLAAALAKLSHDAPGPVFHTQNSPDQSPVADQPAGRGFKMRSRSSTLIYRPEDDSANMPAVVVEDTTDDMDDDREPRPITAHTSLPPVELANS